MVSARPQGLGSRGTAVDAGRADGARRRGRVPPLLQKHMPNGQDFIPFRKKLNAKGQPVPL